MKPIAPGYNVYGWRTMLRFNGIARRLESLEPLEKQCPLCEARQKWAMSTTDEETRLLIENPALYIEIHPMPDPNPACEKCHQNDDLTEEELDAKIDRLIHILEMAA